MRLIILIALFTLPLIIAMVSVRDAETRYKSITDKIRSTR
jgi:hypothetical protein